MSTMNVPVAKLLRAQLENTVKAARDVAEKAAQAVMAQFAIGEVKAPAYLNEDQKALRRRLRAHGRALGDSKANDDTQETQHLVWETAYEHWHRMLFARFLAENGLLMWEPDAPVSLDDCRNMVDNHPDLAMGAKTHWELAGKLAARMLPQVFKPQSPVFEVVLAPEHQRELERLLADLPDEVFKASDTLGWVYQFWQAKRKEEVNASEVKIGADELPAVTQLFTEPYMVDFLLHNSLGAWWVTRQPGKASPVPLTYLRMLEDGTPAAGKFEDWPDSLAELKLLDPCCGSGHFLVAAFLMLVPMRMETEGLSAMDAVDAVMADNLHGLELDARCVEIAVFALALAAWRFKDENKEPLGVRSSMPAPHIACCGLKVAASYKDWEALVPDSVANAAYLRQELRLLHASFAQAPLLGSLLDPARSLKNDLATSSFDTLKVLLERALSTEAPDTLWGIGNEGNDDAWDVAFTARGLLEAARLLGDRYHLVVTNVPYKKLTELTDDLRNFCSLNYPDVKGDLANVFLERCIELAYPNGGGVVQVVMPQNWLFLTSYKKQRKNLLQQVKWNLVARLGEGGFESPQAAGAFTVLLTQSLEKPSQDFLIRGLDVSTARNAKEKASALLHAEIASASQGSQLTNPDHRIILEERTQQILLSDYAIGLAGVQNGDTPRFQRMFWEVQDFHSRWVFQQGTVDSTCQFGGLERVIDYDDKNGHLRELKEIRRKKLHDSDQRGNQAWGKRGVVISQMRQLPAARYLGNKTDQTVAIILPLNVEHLEAIWCYCTSEEFNYEVRRIDQKLNVTNATLVKVPFDLAHWQRVAAERCPSGLPQPYSDDLTQWLFHGHPQPSTDPLQVAVARLLGYRWPAESDAKMELSDEARTWIARCDALAHLVDDDGIVPLRSVRGEKPADERLLELLIAAWDTVTPGSWKPSILDKLLADADCAGKGLDVWLRDLFFEQHTKRFHHSPFIWHVWDGLKDGFSALVNYHKLDAKNLERLTHTYLGDWIRDQEAGIRDGVDGAKVRLAAAQALQVKLEAILEGEAPYDIFVRWKPKAEQSIGWTPDLNDGVRLNIRPFMTAEVLRINKKPKLNIKWDKDRGKDAESAPWFSDFQGERINDHHLTLAEKLAARKE